MDKGLRISSLTFIVLCFCYGFDVHAQGIPVHPNNDEIYEFLDELAALHVIQINDAIKPFSRTLIASKLEDAAKCRNDLSIRQQKELDFYLKEFEKELGTSEGGDHLFRRIRYFKNQYDRRADLFFYRDSLFTMWVNPIGGYHQFINKDTSFFNRWSGLEASAYVGDHWAFYVSFRDHTLTYNLKNKSYLTTWEAMDNKGDPNTKQVYFSDMRGGLSYQWDWGSVSFVKDHFIWGTNYHNSIIFSGRTPSFTMIKLQILPVKWFEFNYVHGFLNSEVMDSSKIVNWPSGAKSREWYPKFLAANMYSLHLWKYLTLSMGNSMIYSNRIQAAYLIPFILFKSVEHTISMSNENNAQIFLNISSRNIKHLHLYGGFYVDEFSFSKMLDSAQHSNWFGMKAGFRLSDLPRNLYFTAEWTRTNPMIYKHYFPTSTFASNNYCLGYYLGDNAREYFFALAYKPIRGLDLRMEYVYADKGPDYPDKSPRRIYSLGKRFMDKVEWSQRSISFRASYQLFHDAFIYAELSHSNITAIDQATLNKYTAPFYQGKKFITSFGVNFSY